MARLRVRCVKIGKLWNIAPGTELTFGDRPNVLLGRNGTGKTTFLRLLTMIVRSDFSPLLREPFDLEYGLQIDDHEVRVRFANQRAGEPPRADPKAAGQRFAWTFTVEGMRSGAVRYTVMATPAGGELRIVNDPELRIPLVGIDAFGRHLHDVCSIALDGLPATHTGGASSVGHRWDHADIAAMLMDVHLTLPAGGGRYDEALGTFAAMLGENSTAIDTPPAADLSVHGSLDAGLFGVTGHFVPPGVIELLTEEATTRYGDDHRRFPPEIAIPHERLGWLRDAVRLFGFHAAEIHLHLTHRDPSVEEGVMSSTAYGKIDFLFTLEDGTVIDQDGLSWGQKRLLSFLYYAAVNESVIIADELVNGLHHGWIGACLQAIDERQSFLTSQNPLLLDGLGFSSAEAARHCFLRCGTEIRAGRSTFVWRNLSEEEATRFFRAYEAGLQHVGEILEVEGLW